MTGLRRAVRTAIGRPAPKLPDDPFAAYRDPAGPVLVSGPTPRHDATLDDDPRVVVLLPHLDLDRMSGGPNTVFQITARLVREGLRLRFVATSGSLRPGASAVLDHVRRITGVHVPDDAVTFAEAPRRRDSLSLGRRDVLIASWWPTAHLAAGALPLLDAVEFLYVVQDYEPAFYPASTKAALAEATYALPMRAVVNEPFLASFLEERRVGRFGEAGGHPRIAFTPAVDRAVFRPRPEARAAAAARRLVFYARPKNPRNLFELGLRALRQAVAGGVFDGPWEFVAVGQELPDLQLSERVVLRSAPWMSYEAYGELLGSADVLLSLMHSPHTSYPPLEMAAAGGQVVTTSYGPKTAAALAGLSPAIHGAAPDVPALVEALRTAVAAPPPSAPALDVPATWDDALGDVVPWVAAQVRELRGSGS